MTAPTHITFAEFIYLLILTTTGIPLSAWNALAVAVSSLLADIDTGASRIGKILPFISGAIERRYGHRTLTHCALFVIAFSVVMAPLLLLSSDLYVCLCVGYLTHPLLDTMTVNGVRLFYPFTSHRCVFPFDVNRPGRYRVQTCSRMDTTLAIIFLVASLPFLYIAHEGYERFIREAQQSIEAAVRDFNEFSRENFVVADIDAYEMLTKQSLRGTFPVVGALNAQTLVFRSPDGRLHTLGKSFHADYVAETVLCRRGERARVSTQSIDLSNQLLSELAGQLDTTCENFLFGELATLEKISIPPNAKSFTPVAANGTLLKLNFATLADIYALGLDPMYITKGLVTVRSTRLESGENTTDSGVAAVSRPEQLVQLAFSLEPGDSLLFHKHEGDTLREGEIIAVKFMASLSWDQMTLNDRKIAEVKRQSAATLIDLDSRISIASKTVRADSVGYQRVLQFIKKGFVAPESAGGASIKLQKDGRVLHQLISDREKSRQRAELEVSRLRLSSTEIGAKANTKARQSEIRSPISGVLVGTRRVPRDSKIRLIVFVRRFH